MDERDLQLRRLDDLAFLPLNAVSLASTFLISEVTLVLLPLRFEPVSAETRVRGP